MRSYFPDEYIDRWGQVFLANPGLRLNWSFIEFLQAPEALLAEHVRLYARPAEDDEPTMLLPAQMEVAQDLAEQWGDLDEIPQAELRGGRLIEPLRHHAFPNPNRDRRAV